MMCLVCCIESFIVLVGSLPRSASNDVLRQSIELALPAAAISFRTCGCIEAALQERHQRLVAAVLERDGHERFRSAHSALEFECECKDEPLVRNDLAIDAAVPK